MMLKLRPSMWSVNDGDYTPELDHACVQGQLHNVHSKSYKQRLLEALKKSTRAVASEVRWKRFTYASRIK